MYLQEKRRELGIEQSDLARSIKTTVPMVSYFENYKCLPTPSMLKDICKELRCEVLDIYEYDELFVNARKIHRQLKTLLNIEPQIYKLTVELPNSARQVLTPSNLEKCGYQSLKDFIYHCCKKFERQLKVVEQNKKATEHSNCSVVYEKDI